MILVIIFIIAFFYLDFNNYIFFSGFDLFDK